MGTKAKAKAINPKAERLYLKHTEVASRLGITAETLRNWIQRGEWPLPHSTVGVILFYRVADIEHHDATGQWPEGVRFKAGVGRGRA